MKKLSSKGFAHHVAILALVVVGVIGGIGSYIYLNSSNADSYGNPLSSKKICEGAHYKRVWKNGTCSKTCQSGYVKVVSSPYDYCKRKPVVPFATITASPKPAAGVTSTYTVKVFNKSAKSVYVGRHMLADTDKPTTVDSGGAFFAGTTMSSSVVLGKVTAQGTRTFKFSVQSPRSVNGQTIRGGIIMTIKPVTSQGYGVNGSRYTSKAFAY